MKENNPIIKIGFNYTDEYGLEFSQTSQIELFEDLGDSAYEVLGEYFNKFLSQVGFYRKRDYMLLDDLTETELAKLKDYLRILRGEPDESDFES